MPSRVSKLWIPSLSSPDEATRIPPPVIACSSWRKFNPPPPPPLSSSSSSFSFSFVSSAFSPSDFFTRDFSPFGFVSSAFGFAFRSSSSDVAGSESDRANVDSWGGPATSSRRTLNSSLSPSFFTVVRFRFRRDLLRRLFFLLLLLIGFLRRRRCCFYEGIAANDHRSVFVFTFL